MSTPTWTSHISCRNESWPIIAFLVRGRDPAPNQEGIVVKTPEAALQLRRKILFLLPCCFLLPFLLPAYSHCASPTEGAGLPHVKTESPLGQGCRTPVANIESGDGVLELVSCLEMMVNMGSASDTVDAIAASADFRPVGAKTVNLKGLDVPRWFRFTAGLPSGANWYFDPDWAYYKTLDFYSPLETLSPDGSRWKRVSFSDDTATSSRLVPLISDGKPHTYYFRVVSSRSTYVAPSLCESEECHAKNNQRSLAFGAFLAVVAAMAIFNFFIYQYLRDEPYLWFVVNQVALLGYFASKQWTPFYSYSLQPTVAFISINICALAMCLFVRSFLNTESARPNWNKLLIVWAVYCAGVAVLGPWLLAPYTRTLVSITANVGAFALGFVICTLDGVLGRRAGCILFLAWVQVAIPLLIIVATALGWTSVGYAMGFNLSLTVEAVILSLVLAYRVRQFKLEREAMARAHQHQSLFVARMSHEIRTPLSAIMGFIELAIRIHDHDFLRQYLLKARSAAGFLMGLIDEIMDFARIEAGKLHLERRSFELVELLNEVAEMVSQQAEQNSNELLFDLDFDLPFRYFGDPIRLKQVLVNLVGNAVKFTSGGEVRLKVANIQQDATSADAAIRARVCFEVSDNGPGISEDLQQRLFGAFEQGSAENTNLYGGLGLGLNISYKLVELMGGRLIMCSEPSKGAIFRFCITLEVDWETDYSFPLVPSDLQGLPVLVVDDNASVRHALEAILLRLGFVPTAVDSGLKAIETVRREPAKFQFVIVDCYMPDMGGPSTLDGMRDAGLPSHVPVMLGALMPILFKEYVNKDMGEVGFVSKPYTACGIFETLMKAKGYPTAQCKPGLKDCVTEFQQSLEGLKILLVDDNEFNLEVAKTILEKVGAAVEIATTGAEALECVEGNQAPYDAVLMDVAMPQMDGIEATKYIRNFSKCPAVPIIAMTANVFESDRDSYLAAGMNGLLSKPIDTHELFSTLKHLCRKGNSTPTIVTN